MSLWSAHHVPLVDSVLHPTDFSSASDTAFAHALAIALIRKTKFTLLHVGAGKQQWTHFPAVRSTLERWGLLEKGSPQAAVFDQLAVRVRKMVLASDKPSVAILEYLEKHPADLLVLATEGREGLPRWIRPSVGEHLARKSKTMSLFVPQSVPGFVSLADGRISLRRILIPVDFHPDPAPAIEYATRAARFMGEPVEIILLHVGDRMPSIAPPECEMCSWKRMEVGGDVVEGIIDVAREHSANLVVMATAGHQGFLDMLRGSVTEQVLRRAPCPLLAVPPI